MSCSKLELKNRVSYALANSNKCFFFKKRVPMMMGFPGKLKTGLLGWGGEYITPGSE